MKKIVFVFVAFLSGFTTIIASPIINSEATECAVLNVNIEDSLEGAWLLNVKGASKSYAEGQLIIAKVKGEYVVKLNAEVGSLYAENIVVNNDEISFQIVINKEKVSFSLSVANHRISGTSNSSSGSYKVEGVKEVLLQ